MHYFNAAVKSVIFYSFPFLFVSLPPSLIGTDHSEANIGVSLTAVPLIAIHITLTAGHLNLTCIEDRLLQFAAG